MKKGISDIEIPQDKLINNCSSWSELQDLTITGVPTIYDIPLAKDGYTYGLILIVQDSIISNRQIKRKFAAYDWCRALGPISVGDYVEPPQLRFRCTGSQLICTESRVIEPFICSRQIGIDQ